MHACPDFPDAISDREDRHTIALVTQTLRGEVAAVDLHSQVVLDEDPSLPGTEFLPVGDNPTAIVSTPGGVASFVGVAEPGLEAIFALPTTCISAPKSGEKAREITLWSACRLPSRPGELAIVAAPESSAGSVATCGPAAGETEEASAWRRAAELTSRDPDDCPANLRDEEQISPAGRRKLLVTLPEQGQLAIYDAQAILNLEAGSFGNCVPDSVVALRTALAPTFFKQPLPEDLGVGPEKTEKDYVLSTPLAEYQSQPAGIALSDGKVYVADLGVPLIHVVDLADPCAANEIEPLRPLDFDNPTRAVFTSEVAVSGRTLAGQAKNQKFLYAIDPHVDAANNAIATASATAMTFDLSEGASRAPIVRSHVPELPFEPPDRIRFEAPIKKLLLLSHDAPAVDLATNTAEVGVLCSPYPDTEAPGSLYRTTKDYSSGAGPRKLRGIFGVMALGTGQIAAIDIEDWDAPCRRPASNNPTANSIDWLGCAPDSTLGQDWFAKENLPTFAAATVTDESSCNVIEAHRVRSGRFFRTDGALGTLAPSLVNFPRLSSPDSGDLPTGKSDTERKHPQMLAVLFKDTEDGVIGAISPNGAFLNVGTTRYQQYNAPRNTIETDPALAENNSLLLPLFEPRVYSSQENFTATYEGTVVVERTSGQLPNPARFDRDLVQDEILLRDPDAWFCDRGVEAYDIARDTGMTLLGLPKTDEAMKDPRVTRFAETHADFVVLTEDFDANNPYFAPGTVLTCAEDQFRGDDLFKNCQSWFGTKKEPKAAREFLIREAQSDDLVIVPRDIDDPKVWVDRVHCCFPSVHSYEVRAGKQWVVKGSILLHHMATAGANSACVVDPSVRRAKLRSRAFEISSTFQNCTQTAPLAQASPACGIGPVDSNALDEVCFIPDQPEGGILPSEFGTKLPAECMYESLKGRFAIYRGREPSKRDMAFKWTVTGGFSPLSTTIASASVGLNVVPLDMVYSESLDALVIVDGASGGVNLVGLSSFSPLGQPYL